MDLNPSFVITAILVIPPEAESLLLDALIALIAISRKVIILDYHSENPLTIIAIALLIGTITVGYYFIKKAVSKEQRPG